MNSGRHGVRQRLRHQSGGGREMETQKRRRYSENSQEGKEERGRGVTGGGRRGESGEMLRGGRTTAAACRKRAGGSSAPSSAVPRHGRSRSAPVDSGWRFRSDSHRTRAPRTAAFNRGYPRCYDIIPLSRNTIGQIAWSAGRPTHASGRPLR